MIEPRPIVVEKRRRYLLFYEPEKVDAALCEIAHERSLVVHMDGARFANALVRLSATPAQVTWQSGIDVLSFGATKAGALAAEAVVFFDPTRAIFMAERRKRAGHLLSKHRFLAAQFAAMLADDRWLALARHANLMADQLSAKLGAVGLAPLWPVEANLVFVVMPRALDARLKAAGARYYLRTNTSLKLDPDQILARLVTSFATKEEEIERFRAIATEDGQTKASPVHFILTGKCSTRCVAVPAHPLEVVNARRCIQPHDHIGLTVFSGFYFG